MILKTEYYEKTFTLIPQYVVWPQIPYGTGRSFIINNLKQNPATESCGILNQIDMQRLNILSYRSKGKI